MIRNEIDWGEAHDWILEAMESVGCTCSDEPEVIARNDDEDGIALFVKHQDDCNHARIKHAHLN